LGGNLKEEFKKIGFGYKQQTARERNITITSQIVKTNRKYTNMAEKCEMKEMLPGS